MGMRARIQNLDEAVYILQSANTHGKGMNLIILPPSWGK